MHHAQAEHDAGGEGLDAQRERAGAAAVHGVVAGAAAALLPSPGSQDGRQHAQQRAAQDDERHAHARAAAGVHSGAGGRVGLFQQIEQSPSVTISVTDQRAQGGIIQLQMPQHLALGALGQ